jgi:excisionase family DNA binding protein
MLMVARKERFMSDNPVISPVTVTIQTAQRLSEIGRTKLYELINKGAIETVRVGKRRLVNFASLTAFLEQGDAK